MGSFFGRIPSRFLHFVIFFYFMLTFGCIVSSQRDPSSIIRIPGDVDILAVLNYRENVDGLRCVGPYNHRVAYDVEALRFAVKMVNWETENLPNYPSLGLTVIDGCNDPIGAIRDVSYALSGTAKDLNSTGPTVAILVPGSEADGVTELVFEEISRRLGILTIGYLPSTIDMELDMNDVNDTIELSMLTSAVPLTSETSVLKSILNQASWFNVGLFYSGYGTGPSTRAAFIDAAGEVGICVSFERDIPYGLTQEMADDFVSELVGAEEDIQVLVWIVSPEEIKLLLRSMRLKGEEFSNVGTSAWNTALSDNLLDAALLEEANRTIFIDDVTCDINAGFNTYISMLDLNVSAKTNPWLKRTIIDGSIGIEDSIVSYTSSLIRAVEMIARGINVTLEETCDNTTAVTDACISDILGAPLYVAVKQNEEEFSKSYCVLVLDPPGADMVGTVTTTGAEESVNIDALVVQNGIYRSDDCMCLSSGLVDGSESSSDIKWLYDFNDPWIPAIFAVSLVFGLFAVAMLVALIFFYRYPVSRKSATLANILLLLGIMMMYIMNIFYTKPPTELICGFRQFGTAFIYAWVFSSLLVKCMATFMSLEAKADYDTMQPKRKKNKVGPCFQLCAFTAFLAPQAALSVQWIAFTPPSVTVDPESCGIDARGCKVSNRHIVISMIYVFALVLVNLFFSLTRIKDGRLMQESRSLFLSSISSAFLMVAWMVCFIIADPIYQTPAICVGVTANATVILVSCFGPPCCVLTYGEGTKTPERDDEADDGGGDGENEDHGDDIAYVNPAFLNNMEEHEATHL